MPDAWESVQLAPLYDVHIGHDRHDAATFAKHLRWIRETPNVLTWNGGDLIENASKLSVGAGVYEQENVVSLSEVQAPVAAWHCVSAGVVQATGVERHAPAPSQ